jgi:hypothetical protein
MGSSIRGLAPPSLKASLWKLGSWACPCPPRGQLLSNSAGSGRPGSQAGAAEGLHGREPWVNSESSSLLQGGSTHSSVSSPSPLECPQGLILLPGIPDGTHWVAPATPQLPGCSGPHLCSLSSSCYKRRGPRPQPSVETTRDMRTRICPSPVPCPLNGTRRQVPSPLSQSPLTF